MLVMGCLTVVFGSIALLARSRVTLAKEGISYAVSMIALGLLFALGNCLSTFSGARFYLPVYALFQMGMMLAMSLAFQVLAHDQRSKRPGRRGSGRPVPDPGQKI